MNGLSQHRDLLARRRQLLMARCTTQREELIADSRELQPLFIVFDAAERGVQRLRQHPYLVLGVAAALLYTIRPQGLRAAWRGAQKTWQTLGPTLPFLAPFLTPLLRNPN